jgi:hypothetical protein
MFCSKRTKVFPRVAWPGLFKAGDVTNWYQSMRDFFGVEFPNLWVAGCPYKLVSEHEIFLWSGIPWPMGGWASLQVDDAELSDPNIIGSPLVNWVEHIGQTSAKKKNKKEEVQDVQTDEEDSTSKKVDLAHP